VHINRKNRTISRSRVAGGGRTRDECGISRLVGYGCLGKRD
jgi:hypothetical protein